MTFGRCNKSFGVGNKNLCVPNVVDVRNALSFRDLSITVLLDSEGSITHLGLVHRLSGLQGFLVGFQGRQGF